MTDEAKQPGETPASNVIFVGQKSALVYAVATLMQLNQGAKEVSLKARGRAISRAVDVVEILRRRFLGDRLQVREIKLDTETMSPKEGLRERNISTIDIVLGKLD
ncbi:MAG: DNA-binding protein Alba [Thermoproteota archaeon]